MLCESQKFPVSTPCAQMSRRRCGCHQTVVNGLCCDCVDQPHSRGVYPGRHRDVDCGRHLFSICRCSTHCGQSATCGPRRALDPHPNHELCCLTQRWFGHRVSAHHHRLCLAMSVWHGCGRDLGRAPSPILSLSRAPPRGVSPSRARVLFRPPVNAMECRHQCFMMKMKLGHDLEISRQKWTTVVEITKHREKPHSVIRRYNERKSEKAISDKLIWTAHRHTQPCVAVCDDTAPPALL